MITFNSFDVLCLTETWLKPNDYIGLNESTPPTVISMSPIRLVVAAVSQQYTALQKFGKLFYFFWQYQHESFLICDNFALIRDNTNYENIFYYINSLYIDFLFDSSKYPPLAAIAALHNLGIRAVSLFKHWLDILLQATWRIAQRWFTLVGHFLQTLRSSSK